MNPLPPDHPDAEAREGWVSPFVSSLLTLPLAFVAWLYASMSPMACDSCEGAEADHFDASFTIGYDVLRGFLWLSLFMLLVSWVLPRRGRHAPNRWLLALLAPCMPVIGFVLFLALVDWP